MFVIILKKDNDLTNYQKNSKKLIQELKDEITKLQKAKKLSSEDRLDFDGSEPPTPPAQKREERSTDKRTHDYKNNPVYPGMKKALKDTHLSKRKYKMAKKQLQEDCKMLL